MNGTTLCFHIPAIDASTPTALVNETSQFLNTYVLCENCVILNAAKVATEVFVRMIQGIFTFTAINQYISHAKQFHDDNGKYPPDIVGAAVGIIFSGYTLLYGHPLIDKFLWCPGKNITHLFPKKDDYNGMRNYG